ncbi:unnamed protein product [Hermetia illucens]|uniref:Uncharacterized protein n=1 Tax=Hermetia illucens TaxID=343691 RepID=A0A7R8YZC5_HERIL|nr:uncharacterized protein LOC119657392 isoform X1 [Hermetia illucens]XP_037920207.1 uncharacterized protein LOC119657392 isoform X1 [Hermetia illucens]XP_037920208.1 uncharacterized protein LOC119657392 isoform X1 [Hermetia illucens]XP_037920209.1 uncharacterized protein LOC119657392 isoform X1 [Hermetia illucens]XP_037920210.1 uncharacterized protein LOC119657392 isoform X1 [Hermetia illucens]CAD7091099.1 unnamed protein product [Hermetia illucens]
MQGFKWSLSLVIVAVVLQTICAMPSIRVKRQDIEEIQEPSDLSDDLNPIEVEVSDTDGLDREKRKLPDGKFAAKNAIIGFVFSNIDNVIDTKTRFLDRLEQANIEKNKQYNITVPPPINDFQTLITAVVSPKITALTSKLTGITAGIFGANTNGNSPAAQGLGQIVTKVLGFSGPIFQGSVGGPTTEVSPDSDEAGY